MPNLIGFDKNRNNVQFKDHCKLSVNFMTNCVYVEPKNDEFKLIQASFEWNFVMKKNLLFIFAKHNFMDFCLEFSNEQMCKKILGYILSGKKNKEITAPISIDESFIKPIFQIISDNLSLNSALADVIVKWMQLLDEEEKEKYSNLMKDYGIHGIITAVIQNQATQSQKQNLEKSQNRKRRFRQIKKEEFLQDERKTAAKPSKRYFTVISSTPFQLFHIQNSPHRTMLIFASDQMDSFHVFKSKSQNDIFKCVMCQKKAFIDVNEDDEICVKVIAKKHSCEPSLKLFENSTNIKSLRKPDYELFENCSGKVKKILVIFDCVDRSQCYEYSWSEANSKFYCRGCSNKKIASPITSKATIRNEETEKEYVEIYGVHLCEKRKYSPDKLHPIFDYVLKPYFEIENYKMKDGKEGQKLTIFDASDRKKYYQYYLYADVEKFYCCGCHYCGKTVTAKLNHNPEGDEYIILSNSKHVCEMRTYVSDKKIILHQPQDFDIMGESKNPKIFVFETNDRKNGYAFSSHHNSYYCLGCNCRNKKDKQRMSMVRGKLLKDEETGLYSFEMKSNQIHCCKPQPYQPEKYEIQIIPKTSDFFYYRLKNGPQTVKLAIQSPENHRLCYTFVYAKSDNNFICIQCRRIKKTYSVKCQKDSDGKEYFEHDVKKHICKPIAVSSISKSDILKEHGLNFESNPKRMLKIDKSKIVKTPNFELRPNKDGVPERKLIIVLPNDSTLCYEFFFSNREQLFYCLKCKTKKMCVSAKLHKNEENGEESFILMGKKEHVCEPIKYQPI